MIHPLIYWPENKTTLSCIINQKFATALKETTAIHLHLPRKQCINHVYVYFYHAYVYINYVYVYFYLAYVFINRVYVYIYYVYTVKRQNCKKQPAVTTILESLTTQSQICYAAERQNTQHQQPRDKGSALKLLAEACCLCDVEND